MTTSTHPPSSKDALLRAASLLGGQAGIATTLGYQDRRNVAPWFTTERPLPAEHCVVVERATNGLVLCEELRPDVAWRRVPDQNWPWHAAGKPLVDVAVTPAIGDA